jgi:hypothetical protein
MKEYKVISPRLGILKRQEKLEEILNQYAREGWCVKFIHQTFTIIVFEINKNR